MCSSQLAVIGLNWMSTIRGRWGLPPLLQSTIIYSVVLVCKLITDLRHFIDLTFLQCSCHPCWNTSQSACIPNAVYCTWSILQNLTHWICLDSFISRISRILNVHINCQIWKSSFNFCRIVLINERKALMLPTIALITVRHIFLSKCNR